jgi:intracellular sulfur oxidation DsrE/DsrF family protein
MKLRTTWLLIIFCTLAVSPAAGSEIKALQGLKSVQLVCDVNIGDGQLLLRRMALLDTTYSQLVDAGVAPTVVVVFRGPASRFITRGDTAYLRSSDKKYKLDMREWLEAFSDLGIVIEQCAIAAKAQKIKTTDFLPQVTLVENGYISLVGYQNRGYALLPMD